MKTYIHAQEGVGLGTAFPTYVPHIHSFLSLGSQGGQSSREVLIGISEPGDKREGQK